MATVRTREITEAVVFYINGLKMLSYKDKYWFFEDEDDLSKDLRVKLVNKELKVEPLEFMDIVRRVKAFSNEVY